MTAYGVAAGWKKAMGGRAVPPGAGERSALPLSQGEGENFLRSAISPANKAGQSRRGLLAVAAVLHILTMTGARAAATPIRLLVLGDSLTSGYGLPASEGFQAQLQAALRARGQDVALIDGAVSGDTTAGGRARLDWVLADGADAAIVELGANDGLRGVDPKEMEANLAAILDTLAAHHIPVLLTGMYAPPNLGSDYQAAFRAVFDRLGRRPGILYDPFFLEGVATIDDLNQADRMHPNAAGVRHIVQRLLPMIETLLARARPA
jgi:acyl-CoA thioesterase-1